MRNIRQYYTLSLSTKETSLFSSVKSICIMDWKGRYFYGEVASSFDEPTELVPKGKPIIRTDDYTRIRASIDTIRDELKEWLKNINKINGDLGIQIMVDKGALEFPIFISFITNDELPQILSPTGEFGYISPIPINISNEYLAPAFYIDDNTREINDVPETIAYNIDRITTVDNILNEEVDENEEDNKYAKAVVERRQIYSKDMDELKKLSDTTTLARTMRLRILAQCVMWEPEYLCKVFKTAYKSGGFTVPVHRSGDAINIVG